jgi:hypothetical protein
MLQFQTIFIFTPFSIKPNQRLEDTRYHLYCLYGCERRWRRNRVGEYFRTTWWGGEFIRMCMYIRVEKVAWISGLVHVICIVSYLVTVVHRASVGCGYWSQRDEIFFLKSHKIVDLHSPNVDGLFWNGFDIWRGSMITPQWQDSVFTVVSYLARS